MSKWREMKEAETQPQEVIEDQEAPGMEETEQAFKEQLDEALVAFKNRREKENNRFADVTDSGYYFVVCFTSRPQMDEFCEKFGIDKELRYQDGKEIAKAFKRALTTPDPTIPREKGRSLDYISRARE